MASIQITPISTVLSPSEALSQTMFEFKLKGKDIARLSGLTEHQINIFKKGGRDPRTSTLVKIVKALPIDARSYFIELVFNIQGGSMNIREFIRQQIAKAGFQENTPAWQTGVEAFLLDCPLRSREGIRALLEGSGAYHDDLAFGIAEGLNKFCGLSLGIEEIIRIANLCSSH